MPLAKLPIFNLGQVEIFKDFYAVLNFIYTIWRLIFDIKRDEMENKN
jgi:hypothetical protein